MCCGNCFLCLSVSITRTDQFSLPVDIVGYRWFHKGSSTPVFSFFFFFFEVKVFLMRFIKNINTIKSDMIEYFWYGLGECKDYIQLLMWCENTWIICSVTFMWCLAMMVTKNQEWHVHIFNTNLCHYSNQKHESSNFTFTWWMWFLCRYIICISCIKNLNEHACNFVSCGP